MTASLPEPGGPALPLGSPHDPARPVRDAAALTVALCDIESVSGNERRLAEAVELVLREVPHLTVQRDGDTVVARTDLGRAERVVLAGHLDTVPLGDNLPCRVEDGRIHGCGTTDMKSGVAVQLRLAARLDRPNRDVTYVFYDNEEVEADKNGLGRVARDHPDWLAADFAVLMEPTNAAVEGGCQGTLRADVRLARPPVALGPVLDGRQRRAQGRRGPAPARGVRGRREVEIDGLVYREGLNAVGIRGGVAGNVIPDECVVDGQLPVRAVAVRGARRRDVVRRVLDGFDVRVTDSAPGALPGLSHPAAAAFVAMVGREPLPKFGWTDVARFSALGVPAVNYGPGDPMVAHQREEYCDIAPILECEEKLLAWLS